MYRARPGSGPLLPLPRPAGADRSSGYIRNDNNKFIIIAIVQ